MSIRYVQLYICRRHECRRQQGFISLVVLVLLVIMIFLGRGLLCFLQQGVENSYYFRQKTQLRLAAESMAEKQWYLLKFDEGKLQKVQPETMVLLDQGVYEGLDYTVFARNCGGQIYIIATAFCRKTAKENLLEPHIMVKGVLGKDGEHYVWRGWAP